MPHRFAPRDRWCIVAYIRALQLSQAATSADAPAGQKCHRSRRQFRGDPGSGATLPEMRPPEVHESANREKSK